MLWAKRAHQSTVFQAFEYSNESSPNSSCHIWNHKVRVYSKFASLFNVMKDNSSVFLLLKHCILWTKRAHQKRIFRLLSGWVKIHQIPHVIFEITSQFFYNICITLQRHERELFFTFLAETLHDLNKRNPSKCKISDFWLLTWNFTKFVLW